MLRRAKWRPISGDCARRKVDDCRQARVHHEPVTVGPMIFEVRTGARDQVEMRFPGRTEHGDQRNGLPPVLADPHDAEAQLRSGRCGDDDGIARSQSSEGPEGRRFSGISVQVPTNDRVAG